MPVGKPRQSGTDVVKRKDPRHSKVGNFSLWVFAAHLSKKHVYIAEISMDYFLGVEVLQALGDVETQVELDK